MTANKKRKEKVQIDMETLIKETYKVQQELIRVNLSWHEEFMEEDNIISDLELYDLRKNLTDPNHKPLDIIGMRQGLLLKWQNKLTEEAGI